MVKQISQKRNHHSRWWEYVWMQDALVYTMIFTQQMVDFGNLCGGY